MAAMAALLTRPPGPRAPRRPPAGPPVRALTPSGVVAAVQAAGLGALAVMVLVLVGWATAADSGASATAAVTGALQAWLVAHHTRLVVPGGTFGLVPLGLTILPVLLLHSATVRAGRAAGVRGRRGVVALTSAVTATYAVIVTVVALLARTDQVRPLPMSAFVGAALISLAASGSGAVRATGRATVLWHRLPGARPCRPAARGRGGRGARRRRRPARRWLPGGPPRAGRRPHGRSGRRDRRRPAASARLPALPADRRRVGAGLLRRAGFRGRGGDERRGARAPTSVPSRRSRCSPACRPGTGSPAWWLVLLVPAAAGVLAGLVADRTAGRSQVPGHGSWRELAETSAGIGAAVGLGVAFLGWLASGSVGPGRMAVTGPTWWLVGLVAAVEVVGGLAAATRGAAAGGPRTAGLTAGCPGRRYRRRR